MRPRKKSTLTGAVVSVKNENLAITKNENVVNMLTGKLPGVRVVQKSSAPGAYDTTIDIRGMGTPLFVVDGVTRDQGYFSRMDPQGNRERIRIERRISSRLRFACSERSYFW